MTNWRTNWDMDERYIQKANEEVDELKSIVKEKIRRIKKTRKKSNERKRIQKTD